MKGMDKSGLSKDHTYKEKFRVYYRSADCKYETDIDWFFSIVQEMAGYHSTVFDLGIMDLYPEGKTWIITRSEVKVNRYPKWPEIVFAETWINNPSGFHFVRTVRGSDDAGNILFESVSYWVLMDFVNNKPVRPDDYLSIYGFPIDQDKYPINGKLSRKFRYSDYTMIKEFPKFYPVINYKNIDSNYHVNNVSYLDWILASLPINFRVEYKISYCDFMWLKQTFKNDQVVIISGIEKENETEKTLYHIVKKHSEDGKEEIACQVKTIWKKRKGC